MKNSLLKSVVLVTLIFTGIFTSQINAQTHYITDTKKDGKLITSQVIYHPGDNSTAHLKYNITYDDQSRVVSREVFKWSEKSEKWIPCHKLTWSYNTDNVTVELTRWNKKEKKYSVNTERSVYQLDSIGNPVAFKGYKWKKSVKEWILAKNA